MKLFVAIVLSMLFAATARAQNPIQWNANVPAAINRAQEQQLPLMFWVTQGLDIGDDDDLKDAQGESFRDPIVVAIAEHHFVPVRVSRNSRTLEEAQKLGLPTSHGLYVALVTGDGRLLERIDPGEVANPEAFATRLTGAFREYRDALYRDKLRGTVTVIETPKPEVRLALQTVFRLNILSADQDIVALLDRKDLVPVERQRLYSMLASFATKPCIDALLSRAAAGDRDAVSALGKAEPGALEFLLAQLPGDDGASEVQVAAYTAAARIANHYAKPAAFWTNAKSDVRAREVEALRTRAASVLEYWRERSGRWR